MKNTKVIVFDMDGVLVDSYFAVYKEMSRLHPGLTEEMVKKINRGNFHEEIEKISIPKISETEEEAQRGKAKFAEDKAKSPLFEGVYDLLLDLHRRGYCLALNTSASEQNCRPLLEKGGILNFFNFLGTKEISKSKAEKFKIIQERFAVDDSDMLFITDTLGDAREAEQAGIPTVAVTYGAHERSYFTDEYCETIVGIVDSVAQLKEFIFKYFDVSE